MKFGIQVDGLNAFNLGSNRLLNIQNGLHYYVISKIHGIGHNYNYVNNVWIYLNFKLYIVDVNVVIKKLLILIYSKWPPL